MSDVSPLLDGMIDLLIEAYRKGWDDARKATRMGRSDMEIRTLATHAALTSMMPEARRVEALETR